MSFPLKFEMVSRVKLKQMVMRFVDRHGAFIDEACRGFFHDFEPAEQGVPPTYDRLPDFLKATVYHAHASTTPTPHQVLALARGQEPTDEVLAQLTAYADALDLLVQLDLYMEGGARKVFHDSNELGSFLERSYPIVDTEQFAESWHNVMRPS